MLIALVNSIACRYSSSWFASAYITLRRVLARHRPTPVVTRLPSAAIHHVCVFFALGSTGNAQNPGMGDVLLRNFFLKMLTDRYPVARISLVAGPKLLKRHGSLLLRHCYAHELIACPEVGAAPLSAWLDFFRRMSSRYFDLCIIDPESITVRALHACLCGVPERVGFPDDSSEQGFLTSTVVPGPFEGPYPDILAATRSWARAIGFELPNNTDFTPLFVFAPEPELLPHLPAPAVAVHVGGDRKWNRRWPLEKYAQLCDRLCSEAGASIYLVGDASDSPECEHVRAHVIANHPLARISNVSGVTLNQTANYLSRAVLFVGNDSGPMHIAGALGRPVVVPVGPTFPHLWKRAYRAQIICMDPSCFLNDTPDDRHEVRRISCSTFQCPYAFDPENPLYPRCLNAIPVEAVWNVAITHLK